MVAMSNFQDALDRIRHIAQSLPDDDPDKLEMINVEGDYSNLMEWAILKRVECLNLSEGCKSISDTYKARQERFNRNADTFKDICGVIMDCANERSYKGSAGTVSYRANPQSVVIVDESKIPDEYKKTTITVDKAALKKALQDGDVLGAQLSNGGESLQVRIK
jgi:hypothetical protein